MRMQADFADVYGAPCANPENLADVQDFFFFLRRSAEKISCKGTAGNDT